MEWITPAEVPHDWTPITLNISYKYKHEDTAIQVKHNPGRNAVTYVGTSCTHTYILTQTRPRHTPKIRTKSAKLSALEKIPKNAFATLIFHPPLLPKNTISTNKSKNTNYHNLMATCSRPQSPSAFFVSTSTGINRPPTFILKASPNILSTTATPPLSTIHASSPKSQ